MPRKTIFIDKVATRLSGAALAAGGAAALVGAAIISARMATLAERKHPPHGRFIEVDGVRLHYLDRGSGPTIVLLHGNGVSSEDFALSGTIDRLAVSHRVIAFDRPGFGYSERPRTTIWTAAAQAKLVAHAMTKLQLGPSVVVGHSWGTLVALNLGLDHTTLVSGLVLMSGYYTPTPRLDALTAGPALPVVGDIARYTVSPLLGWLLSPVFIKRVFTPSRVTERFKAGFPLAMSLRPSQIRASAADTLLMVPDAAKTAGRHGSLTVPTLIISGDGDKIVSHHHQSERLAKEVPGAELHRINGAGHMIHHIAPAEVAEAIKAFSDTVQKAA